MAKRPAKKKQPDHQQLARKVLDAIVPDTDAPRSLSADSVGSRAAGAGEEAL